MRTLFLRAQGSRMDTADVSPTTEDSEEPGSQRRTARATIRKAYTLRFNRLAAWVSAGTALTWALLLFRNWIAPVDPKALLSAEALLRTLDTNLPPGIVPLALTVFSIFDFGLGVVLFVGLKHARLLAIVHAIHAIAACALYYGITKDFGDPCFLAV